MSRRCKTYAVQRGQKKDFWKDAIGRVLFILTICSQRKRVGLMVCSRAREGFIVALLWLFAGGLFIGSLAGDGTVGLTDEFEPRKRSLSELFVPTLTITWNGARRLTDRPLGPKSDSSFVSNSILVTTH